MIFVSYSWINEKPDENVIAFVDGMRFLGYDAKVDIMDMQKQSTINFNEMMAENFKKAEKVIVVLSEEYKKKADTFSGGVGKEYRYIIEDMQEKKQKYVFVTINRAKEVSPNDLLPDFLKGYEVVDVDLSKLRESKLFYRINETDEITFKDVNSVQYIPDSKEAGYIRNDEQEENKEYNSSTVFFDSRIRRAFPGIRGIELFEDSHESIERLLILLKEPLFLKNIQDPIWYFRGASCMPVRQFERLNGCKILLNDDEYIVDQVYVFINPGSYYREFVYVRTKPDEPCGLYSDAAGYEEFGVFNGHYMTRAEFDDGAMVVNGSIVRDDGSFQLRTRHLKPYNFVICAKSHPFNSREGDLMTNKYCEGILNGSMCIEDFVNESLKLDRIDLIDR